MTANSILRMHVSERWRPPPTQQSSISETPAHRPPLNVKIPLCPYLRAASTPPWWPPGARPPEEGKGFITIRRLCSNQIHSETKQLSFNLESSVKDMRDTPSPYNYNTRWSSLPSQARTYAVDCALRKASASQYGIPIRAGRYAISWPCGEPSPLLPIASLVELSLPLGSPLDFSRSPLAPLKVSGSANK